VKPLKVGDRVVVTPSAKGPVKGSRGKVVSVYAHGRGYGVLLDWKYDHLQLPCAFKPNEIRPEDEKS